MSVWLREAAGWVLLGIGLAAFAVCYFVFLLQRRVIEAMALGVIGFTVFRGGLHLLKVAVAARAAREAGRDDAGHEGCETLVGEAQKNQRCGGRHDERRSEKAGRERECAA